MARTIASLWHIKGRQHIMSLLLLLLLLLP
jgi:hypothetical protein